MCSSDRSVARSTGRLVVALLNPAAPEASACSAAGIHWALEDLVGSCLHHRQWHEVQARSKPPPCLSRSAPVRPCLFPLASTQLCLFLSGPCLRLLVQACSMPPPHEVGVCHRLCAVSFSNFLCLFGFARLLVPAPSRLQVCSMPPPTCAYLLHMKSVFVTGYALCLFPTSCVFPRPRPRPRRAPCDFPRPWPPPRDFPRPHTRAPAQIQCGGRFPDPRSTRQTGPTSQHAGHAARNFSAFQRHLTQSHVVQSLDALPPCVDVGLIEVTRGYRIGVEQRE